MKVAFFKLEPWAKEYISNSPKLSAASMEAQFIDEILDGEHMPTDTSFDAVSVFVDSKITAGVLAKFSNLKHIAARSTGYDHIDLAACKEKNITVSYVPAYGMNTVAEFAFALILGLSRKVHEAYTRVRETGSFNYEGLRGFDLSGKVLGVVGTGRIGRFAVKIAKGFGMRVAAYDAFPDENFAKEMDFEYRALEDLLGVSDIVTIHVPYISETHHLINTENIFKMKPGSYLVNTSRGAVVETEALLKALAKKHLAGAALDVLEEEGIIKDELNFLIEGSAQGHDLKTALANHVLIDMPNVIVTPHNAFNTTEALQRILDTTLDNIVGFIKGEPENLVK